jgi:decaprenyl-phosphate phosphoribosyltransferase
LTQWEDPPEVSSSVEADVAGRTEATGVARVNPAVGLLVACRPKQWVKNILVFAVPFLAGRIADGPTLAAAAIAFGAFTAAAAGIYLINDVKDVAVDRAHPKKCHRPIASGAVPVGVALAVGVVLLAGGLALSLAADPLLLVVIAVYEAVQLAYCYGLKHQAVIEMCVVASGFLLRSIAGGVATDLRMSQWFLLVISFGSLFMVAGKRHSESLRVSQGSTGSGGAGTEQGRKVLASYSPSYLRFVWSLAAGVMIVVYALWAFGIQRMSGSVWSIISIVPFVIAVLRYAIDVDSGGGEAPEERVLSDRPLQVLGVAWAVCVAVAIYAF